VTLLSVLGFVQMLVAVTYVVSWSGKAPTVAPGAPAPEGKKSKGKGRSRRSGSFMDGVEERWRRRRDENGR
jgi:hypothetical protein